MKLHTSLSASEVRDALGTAQLAHHVTWDIEFVQFAPERSQSRAHGYKVQLGTYDQTSGPTNSRHYKNSGTSGAGNVWAATYDEWGYFIAEVFKRDPAAKFGQYDGADDFNAKTHGQFELAES
jgi:hypothetical protein